MNPPKDVIVDVDVGSDDYLALIILLHGDKLGIIKIRAIICTNGNTTVHHITRNVVRLLEITGRTDIPVYRGADSPLILHQTAHDPYHGIDGMGDLEYRTEPDMSIVSQTPGAIALHDLAVNGESKDLILLCLAPLTTIALAVKLTGTFMDRVKEVWLMGGNYQGVGNVSMTAEHNFYVDPEAAYILLENAKCPVYMFPWEACLAPKIPLDWRNNVLGKIKHPALEILSRAEAEIAKNKNSKWYLPCDAFMVACFLFPEKCITKQREYYANVELSGCHTRGQVVLDHRNILDKKSNVIVIKNIDKEFFKNLLLEVFQ